jgi:hypothetical protein
VEATGEMPPVRCIAPYTDQATPPFRVTQSTVERSCWSRTAKVRDSSIEAAICTGGCSETWSAASGSSLPPIFTPKYRTVSTPATMPTKKYMTSSSRAEAVM